MNPILDRWCPIALLAVIVFAVWLDNRTIRIPSPMPLVERVMGWIDPIQTPPEP